MTVSSLFATFDGFDADFREDRYLLGIYTDVDTAQYHAKQYINSENYESIQVVEFPVGTSPFHEIPGVKVVFHWHCCEND